MFKIIFVLLLLFMQLHAKSKDSCYTVQLVSQNNSEKNFNNLKRIDYPNSCKIMQIGSSLTVRCGCFEHYNDARKSLSEFQNYNNVKIATTYKYRFSGEKSSEIDLSKLTRKKESSSVIINKKPVSKKDEELRLILQVFLYQGELDSAYKVATFGYEQHPSSYYWNQKMAEICKWTNRSARSMKHMRFIYDMKRDPKIEKELIDYGASAYQYEEIEPLVVNRAIANPTEKNIDLMILVYKKVGAPEEVVKVLDAQYQKDPSNKLLLTKALELSLEMGDLELSKKYSNMIEEHKPYSKKDAALIARYYYISHDIEKSYESLKYAQEGEDDKDDKDHIKYYELKSDIGWYLQDNINAAKASKHLMEHNKARLVDYERITYVYQKKKQKLAAEAAKRAYNKYKLSYLFYTYANGAITYNHYTQLRGFIDEIEKEQTPLVGESLYWLTRAKVYKYYKQRELEQAALEKAYSLESNNFQIKQELLWSYMDANDYTNINTILTDMAESESLSLDTYFTMANAYFFINDVNRASYYTQELLAQEHPMTNLLEFKFLQAYIYQIQNKESSFYKSMRDIVKQLTKEKKKNPLLKKQDRFLSNYLRAAMYTLNPDKFRKKLKEAKPYLSRENYDDISYSWAIQNRAYDKSFKIYHRMKKRELWTDFSNALVSQNSTEINNILNVYLHSISSGDAAQAANADGQVALAQTINFEGLYHNDDSQNAYIQHLELSKKRSDRLDVKVSYYDREPLLQKYIDIKNSLYLTQGYYLDMRFNYFLNESTDPSTLLNVPEDKVIANIGLTKVFDRAKVHLYTAYHNSMERYMEYGVSLEYQLLSTLSLRATAGKNMDALETIQLLLGGKKDMLAFDFNWNILNSTSIELRHEFNSYTSQDNVYLGDGVYDRIAIAKQIRGGYPDLRVAAFYDTGSYSETSGSRGVIDQLQAESFGVLPLDFYNVGVAFSYGMANSNLYTRVWRPYLEFSPYYNSELDDYTYGFNAGYGGKVFHQDHLVLGASYTNSVNGVGGSIFELFLDYKFMYYHP